MLQMKSESGGETEDSPEEKESGWTERGLPPVRRALLVVNRESGVGHSSAAVNSLRTIFEGSLAADIDTTTRVVGGHEEALSLVSGYLGEGDAPAAIIVGGGGGTLRAAVEGVCRESERGRLPGPGRVRLAALRLGSGNLLARQLGVPADARAGLEGILLNLRRGLTTRCAVMRCEAFAPGGRRVVQYATTLGGFGQAGRLPGDLARWHRRLPGLRRRVAGLTGVERLNAFEYALALGARSLLGALRTRLSEVVEVRAPGVRERMRLLAGLAIKFPFKELPFDPNVRLEDAAVSLFLVPHPGRAKALFMILAPRKLVRGALRVRLEAGSRVEFRLLDREAAEYFLDEDPAVFQHTLTLEVMGGLAFIPGPDYGSGARGRCCDASRFDSGD